MQEYQHLTTEEEMRLFLRRQMKEHNSQLGDAAKSAGVKEPWEYARFQNAGYRGLYNGMDEDAIHRHKGLTEKQNQFSLEINLVDSFGHFWPLSFLTRTL